MAPNSASKSAGKAQQGLVILGERAAFERTQAFNLGAGAIGDFELPSDNPALAVKRATESIGRLLSEQNASRVVFGCFELYESSGRFSTEARAKIISLPELALAAARATGRKALLLTRSSCRKAFVNTPGFQLSSERIVFLSDVDQVHLGRHFENVKNGSLDPYDAYKEIVRLTHGNYDAQIWIGGGIEFHLIASAVKTQAVHQLRGAELIDPLRLAAEADVRRINELPTLDFSAVSHKTREAA